MPESLVSLSLMVVGATMATSLLATRAAVGLGRVLMLLNGDRHDEPHSMRPSCIHNRGRQRAR